MKFLLVVLAVRFVMAVIDGMIKNKKADNVELKNTGAKHPAEFQLR